MSDVKAFRRGLADDTLLLRVCDACGRAASPPMPGCPTCGAREGHVVESAGTGTLHTWTVCHVAFEPALAAEVPYTVGLVEVAEGARVVARIGGDPDTLVADMAVSVEFDHRGDGSTVLTFVPEEADRP